MDCIGLLGKKICMTRIISRDSGFLIPVTVFNISENIISQVKKIEGKDGYNSCQLSFLKCKRKRINGPLLGHLKKINDNLVDNNNNDDLIQGRFLKEIRGMKGFNVGDIIGANLFKEGEKIKVTANSKGKGTAGVIKRWGFKIGNMSHGAGYPHRLIGSMGGGRGTNQGIPKGKKMPGRMGNSKVTVNSFIERIDFDKGFFFLKGAVPGPKGSISVIRKNVI